MRAVEPGPRSEWQALVWWERRRLGYNGLLLVLTLAGAGICASVARYARGVSPSVGDIGRLAFLVLALGNLGYTLGWLVESRYRRAGSEQRALRLDERITPEQYANQGVRFLMEAEVWTSVVGALAFAVWYGVAVIQP
jgi:hypothetical protein